jgi:hypothetical protein
MTPCEPTMGQGAVTDELVHVIGWCRRRLHPRLHTYVDEMLEKALNFASVESGAVPSETSADAQPSVASPKRGPTDAKVELVDRLRKRAGEIPAEIAERENEAAGHCGPYGTDTADDYKDDPDCVLMLEAADALEASPNSRTEAMTRIADKITRQAECLEGYAEKAGHGARPVPSVFHSQAMHFRDLADELRAMQAARPIDPQSEGVPASPSGHSPKGGAAISVASPAEPSVPNADRAA